MDREIKTHCVEGDLPQNQICLGVLDKKGQGNANHYYCIRWSPAPGEQTVLPIIFQNGPIKTTGLNGVTNEVLLAIVQDRLEGFQSGEFACDENQRALDHVKQAMDSLHVRTARRIGRGVEGTHVK